MKNPEYHMLEIDALTRQCRTCKFNGFTDTLRSRCDVKKKLVIDDNDVAWKHKHLFLNNDGSCKMYKEKKK